MCQLKLLFVLKCLCAFWIEPIPPFAPTTHNNESARCLVGRGVCVALD